MPVARIRMERQSSPARSCASRTSSPGLSPTSSCLSLRSLSSCSRAASTTPPVVVASSFSDQALAKAERRARTAERKVKIMELELANRERRLADMSRLLEASDRLEQQSRDVDDDTKSQDEEDKSQITMIDRRELDQTANSSPLTANPNVEAQASVEALNRNLQISNAECERLGKQNEELLKQWEDALEYVSKVQRQLQGELKRNADLNEVNLQLQKRVHDLESFVRAAAQFFAAALFVLALYAIS